MTQAIVPQKIDGEQYLTRAACPFKTCSWTELHTTKNEATNATIMHLTGNQPDAVIAGQNVVPAHTRGAVADLLVLSTPEAITTMRLVPER